MNPYQVLGIPKTASSEQIKAAFRKRAKATHPDKNPGNASAAKEFNDVVEAYNILSNPTSRSEYDRYEESTASTGATTDFRNYSTVLTPEEVQEQIRAMRAEVKPYKSAALKYMLVGLAWLCGGLVVTAASISYGQGIVAVGAILFGGIQAVRGFIHYSKINVAVNEAEEEIWNSMTNKAGHFSCGQNNCSGSLPERPSPRTEADNEFSRQTTRNSENKSNPSSNQAQQEASKSNVNQRKEGGLKKRIEEMPKKKKIIGAFAIAIVIVATIVLLVLAQPKALVLNSGQKIHTTVGYSYEIPITGEGIRGSDISNATWSVVNSWDTEGEVAKVENNELIPLEEGTVKLIAKIRRGIFHWEGSVDAEIAYNELILNKGKPLKTYAGAEAKRISVKGKDLTDDDCKNVVLISSNELIARIEDGKLIPLDKGSLTVTGTYEDGIKKWKGTCEVEVTYEPVDFYNGEFVKGTSGSAPVKVNNQNLDSAYVYFKSISGEGDFSFMVKEGHYIPNVKMPDGSSGITSVEVSAPTGEYTIFYALGDEWYGEEYLFGDDTKCYKDPNPVKFYISGNQIHGIELTIPYDGPEFSEDGMKMGTINGEISINEFPK